MKSGLRVRLEEFQSSKKATILARCLERLVPAGEVVQLWPLCVSGSSFVDTCYLMLQLSFQKSEQVPTTKFPKLSKLHGHVASQVGPAKKTCGFATYACHPATFLYTF